MEQILIKLNDAYNELKDELIIIAKKQVDLDSGIDKNKSIEKSLQVRELELNDKAKSLDVIKDIVDARNKIEADAKALSIKATELVNKEKVLSEKMAQLDKELKEVEKMRELFVKKDQNLEAAKVKLEEDRKKMVENVMNELKSKI
jgi:hypothetical protein